ncbi:hypothetical protein AAHE18_09G198900 [Arachis hypogaea]
MVVVILVTLFLHMWQCRQVAAIRVFPRGDEPPNVEFSSHRITAVATKIANRDLINKYFNGRTAAAAAATTQKGFDESKRRVPSCPDPLHN